MKPFLFERAIREVDTKKQKNVTYNKNNNNNSSQKKKN